MQRLKELKKEFSGWDIIFCYLILAILALYKMDGYNKYLSSDLQFVFNRLSQMRSCIADGKYPFFYYHDLFETGYGSSFFYGQLTLFPFLPIINYKVFTMIYIVTALTVTYVGLKTLYKRFASNYKELAIITVMSSFGLHLYFDYNTLACNILAIGMSLFFIAFIVDFFRDGKSFCKAVIMFGLIIYSHLITALISFIICVVVFIYYFDKTRLKEYIKFAICCCIVSAYFICNFLYHSVTLDSTRLSKINESTSNIETFYMSNYLFETKVVDFYSGNIANQNYSFMSLIMFITLIVCFIKYNRKYWKHLICCFILLFTCTDFGWKFIHQFFTTRIQFPTRYDLFIVVLFIGICLRNVDKKWLYVILFFTCIPELLFCIFMYGKGVVLAEYDSPEKQSISYSVGNGEYLALDFSSDYLLENKNFAVDETGKKYDIKQDKDLLEINVNNKDVKLQIPRLYYKGYKVWDNLGVAYKVTKGKCGFINVDLDDKLVDKLYVQYQHPLWLIIIFGFDILFAFWLVYSCFKSRLEVSNEVSDNSR